MKETNRLASKLHRFAMAFWASLLFLMCSLPLSAQNIKVSGVVKDVSGEVLPGVNVTVKGTQNVTITNPEGRYQLTAPSNSVLVFSFVGMTSEEVSVRGRNVINVTLHDDAEQLSEIVVVGYGTQKKSSLTSAISAMKGEELLKAPSTNVSQLLAGKLSGLSSVQESGEPGADGATLRIRGSIYAVSYIVDGFPVDDIDNLDPNDIESISVLKDAASAAVYGLKSAGGVIIVTTKKGEVGKTKITYDGSFGASMNANFPQFMNGPQFAYYYNMAQMMDQLASGAISDRSEYTPYYTEENIAAMTNGDPTDGWDNVNYIDKVFGTGFNQKHNVSVQGGTEKMRYFASVGYMGQSGNIDRFDYRRYNLRTNLSADVAKNVHFTLGVSGNVGRRYTPAFSSGGSEADDVNVGWLSIARQAIQIHPYLPEKYNGYYTASTANNTGLAQSPLSAIYESGYGKTRSTDISTNFSLSYDVPWVKGLQLKVSGSYDNSNSHNKILNTPYYLMAYVGGSWSLMTDPRGNTDGINLGEGSTNYEQLVGQGSITYSNKFGKHNIEALALVEVRDTKYSSMLAYAKNIPFAQLPELSYGEPADSPVGGGSSNTRSAGYVFRAKYDYNNTYLAEFTGRYDGSYKFYGMNGKRWGFFPSFSLAWRMSQEEFMQSLDFIDDLKIRASVGLLGTDNVSPYMFLTTYSSGGNIKLNGTLQPTYYSNGVAETSLTWEKTRSFNVGFDATLWHGLLGLEVDGFYNLNYDILTAQGSSFPPSMGGHYSAYINSDRIENKGIDVMISHRHKFNVAGKPLNYQVSGTLTYATTRWLRHADDPNVPEWQKLVGKKVGLLMGQIADGLFRSEEEIDNSPWIGTRPCVGDIKYVDLNGDGKVDSQDRGYFGRTNRPELTYGLNINAEWNGFDFNAQFTGGALFDVSLTGTYGNGYDDNTIWTQTFKEGANSPLFLVENAWSIDNPNGTFPRLTLGATGHGGDNGYSSSFWWRDGKYVRLKSMQIGYSLPRTWMNAIGIQGLRLYVEGQNIFTIDGLPEGIDPESPGVNNGYYPQQRTVMGGVTLTF